MADAGTAILAPHETTALFGHGAAERLLVDAWRSGRQHHAVMIGGERGVGKATLAFRLARFILAHPDPADPSVAGAPDLAVDPKGRIARLVSRLAHPDLTVLRSDLFEEENKSGEIKVPHVRWALGRIATTADSGWRVCIVDSADDLNRNAANALLKVLEEPPARTVFILVAHRPGRLLATIRSRCIRVDLGLLAPDAVRAALVAAAPEIASAPDIDRLVTLGAGSPGRVLQLAAAGGLDLKDRIGALIAALPALDIARLHALGDELASPRADERFRLWMDLLLDEVAAIVREGAHRARPGERALEPWCELWDNLARAYDETLALNLNRKQLVLNAGFGLEGAARASALPAAGG